MCTPPLLLVPEQISCGSKNGKHIAEHSLVLSQDEGRVKVMALEIPSI